MYTLGKERLSQSKSQGELGFRDFSSFNQALVAKQRWRVLQAKYFKQVNFLNAKFKSNPTFIWRGIL